MASAAVAIMDARSSAASSIIMWCVRRQLELGEEAVVHLDDSLHGNGIINGQGDHDAKLDMSSFFGETKHMCLFVFKA